MNTLKTAAARFALLAPQGQMRWVKLAVYALVFLLPFGMALIALLVYLDQRKRVTAAALAALPAPETAAPLAAATPVAPRTTKMAATQAVTQVVTKVAAKVATQAAIKGTAKVAGKVTGTPCAPIVPRTGLSHYCSNPH